MKVEDRPREKTDGAVPEQTAEAESKPAKKPWIKIVIGLLIFAGILYGIKIYTFGLTHESTDDAQVSGDVVQVSPLVGGTITQVFVQDNQIVKKDELLVQLDDSKFVAALNQAKANLNAAIADAQAAGIDIQYTAASAAASNTQSSGIESQAQAGIGSARTGVASAQAMLQSSIAAEKGAAVNIENAKSDRQAANDALARAQAGVSVAQAALASANAAVGAAQAALSSAISAQNLAHKTLDRQNYLLQQGATSKQQVDQQTAAAQTADSNVEAARQQVALAKASVAGRQADVSSAQAQVKTAKTALHQFDLKIDVSKQLLAAAAANKNAASSQIQAAQDNLSAAIGKQVQSQGQKQQSQTQSILVKQKEAAKLQAQARVDQAKAAVAAAQLDVDHARIVSPTDGRISKKIAVQGAQATVGGALISIVPSAQNSVYVIANFKETQMARIKPGQTVEIDIDAFAGKSFKGHVDSTSAATGATFALLPPDNATGNFVKVVQRVPVKILFDNPVRGLQVGMSATTTVTVK